MWLKRMKMFCSQTHGKLGACVVLPEETDTSHVRDNVLRNKYEGLSIETTIPARRPISCGSCSKGREVGREL